MAGSAICGLARVLPAVPLAAGVVRVRRLERSSTAPTPTLLRYRAHAAHRGIPQSIGGGAAGVRSARAAGRTDELACVGDVVAIEEAQVRQALQHRKPRVRILHALQSMSRRRVRSVWMLAYHEIQRVIRCLEEEKRFRKVHAINPAYLVSAHVKRLVLGHQV